MREFLVALIEIPHCRSRENNEHRSSIEKLRIMKGVFGFFFYYYESGKLSQDGLSIVYTKLVLGEKHYYEDSCIAIDTHEKNCAML